MEIVRLKNPEIGINMYTQDWRTFIINEYMCHSFFSFGATFLAQQFDDAHNNNPPSKATTFKKSTYVAKSLLKYGLFITAI